MTTEVISKIAFWYILIYLILLIIPTAILFFKEFRYLIYFTLDKLCLDWNSKVEKPRIAFATMGYLFIWSAWEISKLKLGDIWFCTPLALLLSIIGLFILYFVLTKSFEYKFIRYVKKKLNVSNAKAIINTQTHNVENILSSLNNSSLKCNIDAFCDFLYLNEITKKDRIEWTDSTVNLIRFIFIFFRIKTDANISLNHNNIRLIIEHYFQKEGNNIKLTETGTEISNVKKELDLNKEIFIEYKNEILTLVNQNTR